MATIQDLVAQAIGTVNQSSAGMQQVSQMLTANTAELQRLSTVNAAEGELALQASQQAAVLKSQADLAQRSMSEKVQNILNINPDVADNELQRSTTALNAAQSEYKVARGQYDSIAQTSLLDDPVGYIFGQLQLPSVAARVNSASAAESAAEDNINTRVAIAKNYNSTVVANTAATLNEASMLSAQADLKTGQNKLRQAEMENSSRIAGQLMNQVSLIDRQSDNKIKVVQMQLQAEQAALNREAQAERRAEMSAIRAERAAKLEAEDAATGALNVQLQRVGQFMGMPEILSVDTLKKFSPKHQQALLEAASSGNFGPDLYSSLLTFSQLPGRGNINSSNPGVANFLDRTTSALPAYETAVQTAYAKEHLGKAMPAKQVAQEAVETYNSEVVAAAKNPQFSKPMTSPAWDSTFNPLKAQHLVLLSEVTAGKLPSLQSNPFVSALQTVASTATPGAIDLTSKEEQRALGVLRDQVATRKLTKEAAAAAIASYYRVATAKNADMFQYQRFGLQPTDTYYGTLEAVGMFGKPIKVDLLNPASIERALMKDVRGVASVPGYGVPLPVGQTGLVGLAGTAAVAAGDQLRSFFNK